MPKLIVKDEFEQVLATKVYAEGMTLSAACMKGFPKGFPGKTVVLVGPDDKPVEPLAHALHKAKEGEDWTLVLRPQGPPLLAALVPVLGTTAFTIGATATTAGLAVSWATVVWGAISLIGMALLRPSMPDVNGDGGYEWDDNGSPQYLSGQSNQLRLGNRVPEVFGNMRVWPDLVAEPYIVYDGDSQILRELYVVSNGICELSKWRLSDELLTTLPTSSVTPYVPGNGQNWPVSFPIVKSNAYVGGIELPGPNETVSSDEEFTLNTNNLAVLTDDYFDNFPVGGVFKLAGDGVNDANKDPVFTVTSISADGRKLFVKPDIPFPETVSDGTLQIREASDIVTDGNGDPKLLGVTWVSNNGTYYSNQTFDDPGFTGVMVNTTNQVEASAVWQSVVFREELPALFDRFVTQSASITQFYYLRWSNNGWNPEIPGEGFATTILRVPGISKAVLFDVAFPTGLYFQAAGKTPKERSVDIQMSYREVGTTTFTDKIYNFPGKSRTPIRFSREFEWPGGSGEYEVYFKRLSDFVEDTADKVRMDAVELTALRGIQDISDLEDDPLNVTLAELSLTTQNAAQVSGQRSFNVLAKRQLQLYLTGDPTFAQTNNVTDAIMHTAVNDGNYAESNINTDALIQIQADLDAISANSGAWNGIIDQTMTVEDQLRTLCGPHRIMVFRRGSYLDFRRLTGNETPVMLINSRTKVAPETKTMTFSLENEPDAVLVRFLDASDNWKEATVQWPQDVTPTNPSEQTLLGITRSGVATRIAQYTWDKKYYEKDVIEVSMGEEGMLLSPGDVVVVSDALKSEQPVEGEITTIQGTDVFTFDQVILAGTYMGRVRSRLGDEMIEAVVTLGTTSRVQQIPEWANIRKPTDDNAQVGLLYEFVPVGTTGDKWIVTNVEPTSDGPVRVSGVNFEPLVFGADTSLAVPKRPNKRRRY